MNMTLGELLRMIEAITGLALPKADIHCWVALMADAVSEFFADYLMCRLPMWQLIL